MSLQNKLSKYFEERAVIFKKYTEAKKQLKDLDNEYEICIDTKAKKLNESFSELFHEFLLLTDLLEDFYSDYSDLNWFLEYLKNNNFEYLYIINEYHSIIELFKLSRHFYVSINSYQNECFYDDDSMKYIKLCQRDAINYLKTHSIPFLKSFFCTLYEMDSNNDNNFCEFFNELTCELKMLLGMDYSNRY